MNHLFIITHTDLDGIGGAAAYLKIAKRSLSDSTVIFSEPYELHETIASIHNEVTSGDKIAIIDLGPNKENYKTIVEKIEDLEKKDIEIEWYDHHIWEDNGEKLKNLGVKLFIDRSTCATGVVIKYATKIYNQKIDGFLAELEKAVCAADLWIWNHPLAPKLFRVVGTDKGENSTEWKIKVIETFLEGKLWDDSFNERLESYINKELKNYEKILRTMCIKRMKGRKVVAVLKPRGPPANSLIGALLISRFNADIAIILRENGALSLRSKKIDVQKVASFLGGGGHPRASGAKIKFPFWVRFFSRFYSKMLTRYACHKVASALKAH